MSTKTLRKRIALVAVTALGAGLLSVVAVPSANAANVTYVAGTTGGFDTVAVGSGAICAAVRADGTTAATLGDGSHATLASGLGTITLPVGSKVSMLVAATTDIAKVSSTAGAVRLEDLTAATVSEGGTKFTAEVQADSVFVVAQAVGTATFSVYTSDTGAAISSMSFKVVASCSSGTVDTTKSLISAESASDLQTDNVDDAGATVVADEGEGYLSGVFKNAYSAVVPAGTWIASATNGYLVDVASGGAASTAAAALTQDTVAAAGTDIRVAVAQSTTGSAGTTVVTLSYNGVTVATKTFAFLGDAASVKITLVGAGKPGTTTYRSFTTNVYDNAGNRVAFNPSVDSTTLDQNVTNADAPTTSISDDTVDGSFITCSATGKTSSNIKFKVLTNAGTYIYSDAVKISCGAAVSTWTVSMDKASYVPGDIATVTISHKDASGNAPFDPYSAADDSTSELANWVYGSSGTAPTVAGSNLTAVVAPAAGDYTVAGVKKYTFTVGATEGDYNLTVSLAGIATDSAAKTVKYSIKSSSSAVSNADVLKAIVSLIASINKQIAALQKALLKK
jgi:hypothetical protein